MLFFGITFSFLPFFLRRKFNSFEKAQKNKDAKGNSTGDMIKCSKCDVYYVEGTHHECL